MTPDYYSTNSRGGCSKPATAVFLRRRPGSIRAFTLIELLVVIGIISLLLSILLPTYQTVRRTTRRSWCLMNIRRVMNGTGIYAGEHRWRLPCTTRTWPYSHLLDFHEVLMRPYVGVDNLHCPNDRSSPGYIAAWWRNWYGVDMDASDHFEHPLPSGVDVVVDYSYYWLFKMDRDVNSDGNILRKQSRSWKLREIPFPSRLIAYTCFPTWDGMGWNEGTVQSGFLDGHAAAVPPESIYPTTPYDKNLDWTKRGVLGWDID